MTHETIKDKSKNIQGPSHNSLPESKETVCFASSGTVGVVDLGASQTVMGHQQLKELLDQLPSAIRVQVRRAPCQIVFRFGNHQTLTSKYALMLPLQGQWIRIAIVNGNTPFLLSSSFLKCIKAVIDTEEGTLWSKLLGKHLHIERNSKELFLMDINQLWQTKGSTASTDSSLVAAEIMTAQTIPIPLEKEEAANRSSSTALSSHFLDNLDKIPEKTVPDVHRLPEVSLNPVKVSKEDSSPIEKMSLVTQPCDSSENSSVPCDRKLVSSNCHVGGSAIEDFPCSEQAGRRDVTGGHSGHVVARTEPRSDRVWKGPQGKAIPSDLREFPTLGGLVCGLIRDQPQAEHQKFIRYVELRLESEIPPNVTAQMPAKAKAAPKKKQPSPKSTAKGAVETEILAAEWEDEFEMMSSHAGLIDMQEEMEQVRFENRQMSSRMAQLEMSMQEVIQHLQKLTVKSEVLSCANMASECVAGVSATGVTETETELEFKSYHRVCRTLIQKMMCEVAEVQQQLSTPSSSHKRLDLLEVMCSSNSELTQQVLQQFGSARRFGLSEGDLSQSESRKELFKILIKNRPRHVWYSPICGPWCQWSHLNMNKSIDGYHRILTQRSEALWQISLAVVLYQLQVSNRSHFHMEQPQSSQMWMQKCLDEMITHTLRCSFDLCVVGHLKDPTNALPIRKRLTVQTTSAALHSNLHGQWCPGAHIHQQISGKISTPQGVMNRSQYTENYPPRFARQIAKVLLKEKPWESPVYASENVVDPANNHPTKKRRLGQKMSPEDITTQFHRVDWQTVMTMADRTAPRVGILCCAQDTLCDLVQQLCPRHQVHHLVLCRGTDRYVGPSQVMQPGIAPFRRRICIRRRMEDIVVDPEWEQWERLTHRGLRRKGIPARVSLTIFASLKVPTEPSLPSAESKRPGEDMIVLQPEKRTRIHEMADPRQPEAASNPETGNGAPEAELKDENPRNVVDLVGQKHGPKFLQLDKSTQMWLLKLHRNLGHPSAAKLVEACRQLNCSPEILNGLADLKCSTCVENQRPSIPRISSLKTEGDFGDSISMDGITWSNHSGHQYHFYHFLDHHTMYHTAVVSMSRTSTNAIRALNVGWMLWAGPPAILCLDAATEFTSDEFQAFLQRSNIKGKVIATEGHWQNAHIERHGQFFSRSYQKWIPKNPLTVLKS